MNDLHAFTKGYNMDSELEMLSKTAVLLFHRVGDIGFDMSSYCSNQH